MENLEKKKLIIIGAGISGMTAGIYALDNGYDVTYMKSILFLVVNALDGIEKELILMVVLIGL